MKLIRVVIFLFLIAFPVLAIAAPSVGNTTNDAADAGSFSFSHDSQGYDLLIVRINVTGGKDMSGTLPTYGGQNLTLIRNTVYSGGTPRAVAYYLANPPSGSNTLAGSFDGANKYTVSATNVNGVNTSNPVDGATSAEAKGGTSISVDVTSPSGDLAMDIVCSLGSSLTVDGSQSQQFNLEPTGSGERSGGSSEAGSGTTTMSWTKDGGKETVTVGFNVNTDAAPRRRTIITD